MITGNDITLTDGKNVITNEYEIPKTFSKHYMNIVKNRTTAGSLNGSALIDRIIKS